MGKLLFAIASAGVVALCRSGAPTSVANASGEAPPPPSFRETVRPVLAARCSPCHEKGGTMYAKLPFDDPETLASHVPGVRKRLKGDDLTAFESWLRSVAARPDRPAQPDVRR